MKVSEFFFHQMVCFSVVDMEPDVLVRWQRKQTTVSVAPEWLLRLELEVWIFPDPLFSVDKIFD